MSRASPPTDAREDLRRDDYFAFHLNDFQKMVSGCTMSISVQSIRMDWGTFFLQCPFSRRRTADCAVNSSAMIFIVL